MIIYGEAFEFGIVAGLADKAYLLPRDVPFREFLEARRIYGKKARKRALEVKKAYSKIVKGNSAEIAFKFLEWYTSRKESIRSKKIEISNVDAENIVTYLELGRRMGDLIKEKFEEIILEPGIPYYGKFRYPDFIGMNNGKIAAVGDFKVYHRFLGKTVWDATWAIEFESYTLDELLARARPLTARSYKDFFNVLSKYAKLLFYARILEVYPIDVLVIFPQVYSKIRVNSKEHLETLQEKIRELALVLLPRNLGKSRGRIARSLDRGDSYIKISDGKIYLGESEIGVEEEFRALSGRAPILFLPKFRGGWRRKKHREDIRKIFKKHDFIVDASDQGVGKTTTAIGLVHGMRTLVIAPRKKLLEQIMLMFGEYIDLTSEGNVRLEKEKTFYDVLEAPSNRTWQAHKKVMAAVRDRDTELIPVTSDAFKYLREGSWKEILKSVDAVIIEELTNSGSSAIERLLGFLRYYSRHPNGVKVMVLDGSLTSPKLHLQAILDHLRGRKYTPSQVSLHEVEDPVVAEFSINKVSGAYYRIHLDFPLKFSILPLPLSSQIPNWALLISKAEDVIENFKAQLNEGDVMFYVDNRIYVEDLANFLAEKGFPVSIVHAEKRETIRGNVVGTSSIAFGVDLKDKGTLVVISPYRDYSFEDHAHNVEVFRQIIKRIRGDPEGKEYKNVVFVPLSSPGKESIMYFQTKAFINRVLTNRKFHVILPMSSGSFYHVWKSRAPGRRRELTLEDFLREYYPSLKRILASAGFIVRPNFKLKLSFDREWDLPIHLRVYRLLSGYSRRFWVEVMPMPSADVRVLRERLKEKNPGARFLKSRLEKLPEDPKEVAKILSGLLTPKEIEVGYSSILMVPYSWGDKVGRIPQVTSPLKRVFVGDWEYFEMPVKVVNESGDEAVGIYASHPAFSRVDTVPIVERLKEVLSAEIVRENVLFLPNVWKAY
ncbi:DEAD/DEAH box helicase family protein [Pyrococcus kukulkanii]|uniref:Uncharacterized protein n=1 Tax=Pyrococcus kukulkanii TaxID=1609559 RepID=A0A127B959_9EURY|nr:hypothetical protein [Pyrococcus kukulkanii]AMM53727.1 hypothetical protein TQ32_03960 [Pyrococcus kukulkanii]